MPLAAKDAVFPLLFFTAAAAGVEQHPWASALIVYCWIKITPKISSLKQQTFIISHSFRGPVIQKWLSGVPLSLAHRKAIKLSAGAAVFWRLDWGWRSHFQDGALTWLLAESLSPLLAIG